MVEGRDEDEWRKRLTAKLRDIPSMLLIDNLRRQLDASSVAAALTAPYWEDRVLGKSEMTRFPIRCVWIATGNNPQFSNEIARRMVRIRLDPHEDQPWLRKGFRHPNLLAWVWQNRPRLVAACLTLGQAWIAAGRPQHPETIGSFEGWAQVLGGILDVAGVPGFLGNLEDMYERADAEGSGWRVFIAQWWERFGTQPVGVADLFELAGQTDLPLARGDERAKRTSLGQALRRTRDRIFMVGELRLRVTAAGNLRRAQQWQLALTESAPGKGSRGSHDTTAACEPRGSESGGSHEVHTEIHEQNQRVCEPCEPCEPFSPLRVRGRAHVKDGPGKGSQGSQGSHWLGNPRASACEPPCEPPERGSPRAGGWWEEVL